MTNATATIISSQGLSELKEALEVAETPEDFLSHAAALFADASYLLALPLSLGTAQPLSTGASAGADQDNGPLVYEFLGALDLANAADERLWTTLAFTTYRDYMEERWSIQGLRTWKKRVRSRWIMGKPSRGRLIRHGIARLWWVTNLTYELPTPETRDGFDPFRYSREVLSREDRLNSIFDREAGAIPNVIKAVLDLAAQGGIFASDNHLRAVMKEITLIYGYRDISALPLASTHDLVSSVSAQILEVRSTA